MSEMAGALPPRLQEIVEDFAMLLEFSAKKPRISRIGTKRNQVSENSCHSWQRKDAPVTHRPSWHI
jgi:hypothetical protein